MIRWVLDDFVTEVLARGSMSRADIRRLQRDIFPDGIESRDEADVLIALDRAIAEKDCAWGAFLIQAVAEYVVWTTRPTGRIDRETAEWLTASLGAGSGPTEAALAIGFEIVCEAEASDERLVAFLMRWNGVRRPLADAEADRVPELVS